MNDEIDVNTHDFEQKFETEKLIQMLLLSSDVGSSVSSDPQFIESIRTLSNLRLDELASIPQRIQKEEDIIRHKTEQLAVENYPIFLANANTSREVHHEFQSISDSNANLVSSIAGVSSAAQTIFDNIGKNASAFRTSAKSVQKYTQISEFLELPQLMETCIQNGYYQDALNILNHTKQMNKKYGRTIPIVRLVGYQVREISGQLFSQLCKQLREPITLPVCLKVVIYLRQLEAFTEQELRLNFLQARGICIKDQLEIALAKPIGLSNFDAKSIHLSGYQQPEYKAFIGAMRRIEVTRVQLFDSITQYRAVFADEESYSSKLPDPNQQPGLADISPLYIDESTRSLRYLATNRLDDLGPCSEGSLFHSWLVQQIGIFLDGLSGDLRIMLSLSRFTASEISDRIQLAMANDAISLNSVDTSAAFQQIHSIMTQALYFGRSFARIGCDFRAHLGSLFSQSILSYLETLLSNALTELCVVLELWPWELVEPSLSSQPTDGNPEEVQAPFEIAHLPAIAFFCNRVLSAFNGLRICCPVGLRDGVLSALVQTLNGAASAIVSAHKSRQLDSPTARAQSLRLAIAFAHTATPHLFTCLLEHIFGGDAASHHWQLHQEGEETLTTSQLIARLSKDVCSPIFDQWGQLAQDPMRAGQPIPFAAESQSMVAPKASTTTQIGTINSVASETPMNERIKSLEQPVLNSVPTDVVASPKNNELASNNSRFVNVSSVISASTDQQTMPTEGKPQLLAIGNAEGMEVNVSEEPMDKVAISELSSEPPFQSDYTKASSLANIGPLVSEALSSLPKSEYQESAETLSTFKLEFDGGEVGKNHELTESSDQTPSTLYPEGSHSDSQRYMAAERVELKPEVKEDFVKNEPRLESPSTDDKTLVERGFRCNSGVETSDQIYEIPVDENGNSSVLDRAEITALHVTPDSVVVEHSDAMNPVIKQDSDEISYRNIKVEDERISQECTINYNSVANPISILKSEEPDRPDHENDDLNYAERSFTESTNHEILSSGLVNLSGTLSQNEFSSVFMHQPENVANDSFMTEKITEVYNAEYAEPMVKVENIKIEESFSDRVKGSPDQAREERARNIEVEDTGYENKEIPLKSELDFREMPNSIKEEDTWNRNDGEAWNNEDEHNEPILHYVKPDPMGLELSYSDSLAEHREPHNLTNRSDLSDAKHTTKCDDHEAVYGVGGTEALTQTLPIVSDKDGSGWEEKMELPLSVLSKEGADRTEGTVIQDHPAANYFKTEMTEEGFPENTSKSVTQDQSTEGVNSSKLKAGLSMELGAAWGDDRDGNGWCKEAEYLEESAVYFKPNLDAQTESEAVGVKPDVDQNPSLLKSDDKEAGNVWGAGTDFEVKRGMDSESLLDFQSGKLDEMKLSLDYPTKSEVILPSFEEPSNDIRRIPKESKICIEESASFQSNLDILAENQEVEMSSSFMECPGENQNSNLLEDDHQEAGNARDDDVFQDDVETKNGFTSAETVIMFEKSGSVEKFVNCYTETLNLTPSNKELPESISVHSTKVVTSALLNIQEDKEESLDFQTKSEVIETTPRSPSNKEVPERVEKLSGFEGAFEDNEDGLGEDADVEIDELDLTKTSESTNVAPPKFDKAEITVTSLEEPAVETLMKSDHHALEELHSKEPEELNLLPGVANALDDDGGEKDNAWIEVVNHDETNSASALVVDHPSHEEHLLINEIAKKEPGEDVYEGNECWEEDGADEMEPIEMVPQLSQSNPSNQIELDLKDSEKKGESADWDNDDADWGEDQNQIKVLPQSLDGNAQTPDENNTSKELKVKSTESVRDDWGANDNDWSDGAELSGDNAEMNKSIADRVPPSTTPVVGTGDFGAVPKDRSKGAKLD